MKNKKAFPRLLLWLMVSIIVVTATTGVVLAVTGNMPAKENAPTGNPDDQIDYIGVNPNGKGGQEYKFELGQLEGTVYVDGDYVYKFGYYFTSANGSSGDNSATGWVAQPMVTGWGCVVRSSCRNKTSLSAPAGAINGYPVTYMTYAYTKCVNMKYIPAIPSTVINTDRMFNQCSSLTDVDTQSIKTIGSNMFSGCTKLSRVFISSATTTISGATAATSPFSNTNANCEISCSAASKPSGFGAYWNYCAGAPSNNLAVEYGADYYIWRLSYSGPN